MTVERIERAIAITADCRRDSCTRTESDFAATMSMSDAVPVIASNPFRRALAMVCGRFGGRT
jgi:hypothetical protein